MRGLIVRMVRNATDSSSPTMLCLAPFPCSEAPTLDRLPAQRLHAHTLHEYTLHENP
jgi:hypothetical protein